MVLLLVATVIKECYNRIMDEDRHDHVLLPEGRVWPECFSTRQHFTSIIRYDGRDIIVRESWVESRSKIHHFLVLLSNRTQLDGYVLCFSLSSGKELFQNGNGSPFG